MRPAIALALLVAALLPAMGCVAGNHRRHWEKVEKPEPERRERVAGHRVACEPGGAGREIALRVGAQVVKEQRPRTGEAEYESSYEYSFSGDIGECFEGGLGLLLWPAGLIIADPQSRACEAFHPGEEHRFTYTESVFTMILPGLNVPKNAHLKEKKATGATRWKEAGEWERDGAPVERAASGARIALSSAAGGGALAEATTDEAGIARFDPAALLPALPAGRVEKVGLVARVAGSELPIEVPASPLLAARAERERLTGPCDLRLSLAEPAFLDRGLPGMPPNRALDAGEEGVAAVVLENRGPGIAYSVGLAATSAAPGVSAIRVQVGDIGPSERRNIEVPLSASLEVGDGLATVRIQALEQRGAESGPIELSVETARLLRPVLDLAATAELRRGASGDAGARIEVTATVLNRGEGSAAVEVSLEGLPAGAATPGGRVAEVPRLAPGERAEARLTLTLPASYGEKSVGFRVRAADGRGFSVTERPLRADLR